ncbi:LWR-salt protein [Natronococcus sp.]|uniref:LWR-salt protein n=1 Tax=Natronococcus sp. TaxID=35747 RepID=UPI0025D5C744|nr:LWR-salt protein [Natronococcus sp.]
MEAAYVFRVRLRLEPATGGVRIDGDGETTVTVSRDAPEPGTEGWLFFRNTLWRGEVGDEEHARRLAADWLGEPLNAIEAVSFRELRTDETYLEALKAEIADDLEAFNADDVSEVLSKYLGSSIHVVDRA